MGSMMRSKSLFRCLQACLLLGLLRYALAAEPVLMGNIDEVYSQSVNVGVPGGTLVGLWQGTPPDSLDVRLTRVFVPSGTENRDRNVCFSAITRDGEYSARGTVRVPNSQSTALGVEALRRSRYVVPLSRYNGIDFAVNLRWAKSCAVANAAAYLPAIGGSDVSTLIVAFNSRHATNVSAVISQRGVADVKGRCEIDLVGRSRAFDARCKFILPDPRKEGLWLLAMVSDPIAGPRREDDFNLLLQ